MRRLILFVILASILVGAGCFVFVFPAMAVRSYGPPSDRLSYLQSLQYSAKLVWDDGILTKPMAAQAAQQAFTVGQGESIASIADRLLNANLISDDSMFRDYLVYTGLDTSIQAGQYELSPALSMVDIAHKMQDSTPEDITFVLLPGWRMEEVAASLASSGLNITPEAFLAAAGSPHQDFDFLAGATSAEGFLYPDSYILPRSSTANQLVDQLIRNFGLHLTRALHDGFARQGLSDFQAVTLAAIVERETVQGDEAPMIASVYLNRLRANIRLEADPTVQYALGYDPLGKSWWTNPLSAQDLQVASPFNTYVNAGLPPGPIDNPGQSSLQAVASPADTPYLFFRARCDGSGYHNFAKTFEEHLNNACP